MPTDHEQTFKAQPISMFCAACGKPWHIDTISSRAYTCPCGCTTAKGSVTMAAWPDGGAVALDGVERDYGELLP